MRDLIEDLPGEHAWLPNDLAAVFRVSVAVEVGALIDIAFAACIDDDTERIIVLLELIADREIPEGGALMSQATEWQPDQFPWAARRRERHHSPSPILKRVPRTFAGPIPARDSGRELRIGFKATARQHDGPGAYFDGLSGRTATTPAMPRSSG